jgi:anti-sigma factor RsiW
MTGAVLQFTKSAHQRALEALPWFLTGTLDEDERSQVEQHLQDCAACRAELASQQALRAAVASGEARPPYAASFAQLRRRLDAADAQHAARGQGASARPGGSGPGLGWLAGLGRLPPALTGLALVAQLVLIVVLGSALVRSDHEVASYHALSAAGVPAAARGNLVVVFDPQVQLVAVQALLSASGARIVDGPLPSGGYVLSAAPASLAATLTWLRAQHAVTLAERLDATVAPAAPAPPTPAAAP